MDWTEPKEMTDKNRDYFYYYTYLCYIEKNGCKVLDRVCFADYEGQQKMNFLKTTHGSLKPQVKCIWATCPDYFPIS